MNKFINILIGGEQKNQSIKTDGVCTCLCSSMGMGGGYVPMIVLADKSKVESRKSKVESRKSKDNISRKIKRQVGVDLCFVESRLVEISACVCVRYDAGICRHKMEHTGVLIEFE